MRFIFILFFSLFAFTSFSKDVQTNPKQCIFSVQAPNGIIYEIQGPCNSSQDDVFKALSYFLNKDVSTMQSTNSKIISINGRLLYCVNLPISFNGQNTLTSCN